MFSSRIPWTARLWKGTFTTHRGLSSLRIQRKSIDKTFPVARKGTFSRPIFFDYLVALVGTTSGLTIVSRCDNEVEARSVPAASRFMSGQASPPLIAVVTGAAGTLGTACVRALVAEGYRVVAMDLSAPGIEALAEEFGEGKVKPMVVDLTDVTAVKEACKDIEHLWGTVSVLVNNAGILSNNKCRETSPEEFKRVMDTNVASAFYLTRELLPAMRKQRYGRIVNTTSMAAKCGGVTAGTAYVVSKGALQSLTFALARECARDGVTVNAVSPAYVRTPMVEEQLSEAQRQAVLAQVPVGRFCESEEFAHVVQMLVHPLAGFITGEVIDQNGGMHMD
ncbi:unnamed protein product [Discosporangium mesarthrocarpum]